MMDEDKLATDGRIQAYLSYIERTRLMQDSILINRNWMQLLGFRIQESMIHTWIVDRQQVHVL